MTVANDVGNLFPISAPEGKAIAIPLAVDESSDPYLRLDEAERQGYYREHGYVVWRGLVDGRRCEQARSAFAREVKPYGGFLYRQASGNPERHVLTEAGHVLNSILNVQDLQARRFPTFRAASLAVITSRELQAAVRVLLGEPGALVQSMYFEGNPSTWAHQDTYYLDSADIGRMVGSWIALEDIAPGAGRFYIYPGSHRIDMAKNGGNFDVAFNHDRYKRLVLDVIQRHGLECRAPALRKGDVLFWNSKTIHGSLETVQPQASRSSLTAHFIPRSRPFLQYQTIEKPLRLRDIDGIDVHHPKDQNRLLNRAVMLIETRVPDAFRLVKRVAIKLLTS
jgi:phytanoyl-CoA hydroxylase